MAAYMIIAVEITDRAAFVEGYGRKAAELIEKMGGRYRLRAPGVRLLEGDFGDGASIVVSEWPDKEAVLRFWNSPEYAEIKQLRTGVSKAQVLMVEAHCSRERRDRRSAICRR